MFYIETNEYYIKSSYVTILNNVTSNILEALLIIIHSQPAYFL